MSQSTILKQQGHWWTPTGWLAAQCEHTSHVLSLTPLWELPNSDTQKLPDDAPKFIPAPVDLHVHGGGGHDCMHGEAALRGMLQAAAKTGTGALLATSLTAPTQDTDDFLASVKAVMDKPDRGSATLLGAHLEGPFINPDKLGAQPPFATAVDASQLEKWLQSGVVKVITFAPEMDTNEKLIALCQQHQVRPQIGHTLCSCAQAERALRSGCGVTHLFNAMGGFNHREPGAATVAMAYASFAEIITDGLHVEQSAFEAARRAIPKLYSVTDATAATGMPDGQYTLGSMSVHKQGESVRLADGTLAGSCLTQLRSIEVLRSWGIAWHSIAKLTSATPALWIDEPSVGQISSGSWANWLEIQEDRVVAKWQAGVRQAV